MKLLSFMFWKRVELKTNDDVKKKLYQKNSKVILQKPKCVVHILKQLLKSFIHISYVLRPYIHTCSCETYSYQHCMTINLCIKYNPLGVYTS